MLNYKNIIKMLEGKKKIILISIFFLLLIYGSVIRIYGVGEKSFWIDESMSALAAKKIHEHGIPKFESGLVYSRALVFHYLMSGFLLLGYNEFNARLISVIFGLATCVLIFFIAKEYNKHAAWIAFVFSLFLEIFIVYSRQARMYQMEMFFFFLTVYLLNKGLEDKRYVLWAIASFLIAYDTHPIALILVPIFGYVFMKNKMRKWVYAVLGIVTLYFIYQSWYSVSYFRFNYLMIYLSYLKYYLPFIFLGIVGAIISFRKKLTWFLGFSVLCIIALGGLNQLFALRYVYLAFFTLLIFSAITLSKIRWKWMIVIVYLLWISNLFTSITNAAILIPQKQLSNYDFTAPEADFKGFYKEFNLTNETFVATLTLEAEWYFKKPDYWTYFSFTGLNTPLNETWEIYEGKDVYTGADIIYSFDDFKALNNSLIVIDYFAFPKVDGNITNFISNNCTITQKGGGIIAYYCK